MSSMTMQQIKEKADFFELKRLLMDAERKLERAKLTTDELSDILDSIQSLQEKASERDS